jgi:hypothetical protein
MALIIKKITKQIPQSASLETFLTTLGVTGKAELYLCNSNAYLNADIILPVLSVPIQWFLKNAETPTHYIKIKPKSGGTSQVFVNKYGMTKLLSQSKEAVAFKLQDYLYELLYKVETEGTVAKDDVSSRRQLVKMTTDLDMYQSTTSAAILETIELKESINTLRTDYAETMAECLRLNVENEKHEATIKDLEIDLNNYKNIANKLAKYVRINSKKPPTEAYDDSLDTEDNPEDMDEVTSLKITSDAINAKKQLRNIPSKKPSSKPVSALTVKQKTKTVSLLRSADGYGVDYKWILSDKEYDDSFKQLSKDYCLGDIETPPDIMIWYADIEVTEEKRRIISLFLSLNEFYSEATIVQLIQ